MKKNDRQAFRLRNTIKHAPPGISPGSIHIKPEALTPKIKVYSFNSAVLTETEFNDFGSIKKHLEQNSDCNHWIEVKGFGDKLLLETTAEYFRIHRLELEDVVNVYQRPKLEESENHLFLTSRMFIFKDSHELKNEQLSLFLGKNYVLTFQEKYDDIFEPVRERLRKGKGFIRNHSVDYLAYALLDAVVDNYFPLLESLGEKLDELEMDLLLHPNKYSLKNVVHIKRQLILLRKAIWAERDKINDLLRTNTNLVTDDTKRYLKDTYDHCIQTLDTVESYKEITSSMMDIYLSSVSNRMNQIMKVLAVISTIFIPLTFIVGVYGMNFSNVDPNTGKKLPLNMPELYSPYGYPAVMILMVVMVIIQLYIFYRKGWLSRL